MNPRYDFKFIYAVDYDNTGKRYTEIFKECLFRKLIVYFPFSMDSNEDLKRSQTKIRSFRAVGKLD